MYIMYNLYINLSHGNSLLRLVTTTYDKWRGTDLTSGQNFHLFSNSAKSASLWLRVPPPNRLSGRSGNSRRRRTHWSPRNARLDLIQCTNSVVTFSNLPKKRRPKSVNKRDAMSSVTTWQHKKAKKLIKIIPKITWKQSSNLEVLRIIRQQKCN